MTESKLPRRIVTLVLSDRPPRLEQPAELADPRVVARFPFHRKDASFEDLIGLVDDPDGCVREAAGVFWEGWRNGNWFTDTDDDERPFPGGLVSASFQSYVSDDTVLTWLDPPTHVMQQLELLSSRGVLALFEVRMYVTDVPQFPDADTAGS